MVTSAGMQSTDKRWIPRLKEVVAPDLQVWEI
jgi:hypothetical protein